MKAIWNGGVVVESDDTVVVEGNHYFPMSAVNHAFLVESETTSHCPWKGVANYYSLRINGQINTDAAWYYKSPKPAAADIAGRLAFWRGVEIVP